MESPMNLFIDILSCFSSLILCLGMCRALRMRSNTGYVLVNMGFTIAYLIVVAFGVAKAVLYVPMTLLQALILPLVYGTESKLRCAVKGLIGILIYNCFGLLAEIPLAIAMGGNLTAENLQNVPLALLLLVYLIAWPTFALILEGFARVCKRLDGQASDVTLLPIVGYLAIGFLLCMIKLALRMGCASAGIEVGFRFFVVFIIFYIIYMAVLGVMLWRHVGYLRAQRVLRQQEFLDAQLKAVQAGYGRLLEAQNQLRRIRHDIANHLQVMQMLVAQGKADQATAHLQTLRHDLGELAADNAADQDDLDLLIGEGFGEEPAVDEAASQMPGKAMGGTTAMVLTALVAFVPQLAMITEAGYSAQGPYNTWFSLPMAVLLGVLCLVADAALVLMMHRKEQAIDKAHRVAFMAETRAALGQFRRSAEDQHRLATSVVSQIAEALDQAEQGLQGQDLAVVQEALTRGVAKADEAGSRICDNAVASAVVGMERDRCLQLGVSFDCDLHIPEQTPLAQTQLAAVLFNLLDNAVEAASKNGSSDERGWVRMKAGTVNGNFVIDVQNTCNPNLKGPIVPSVSPRDRQGLHGWGLGNVVQIAQSHRGTTSFFADKGTFTATVVIFDA